MRYNANVVGLLAAVLVLIILFAHWRFTNAATKQAQKDMWRLVSCYAPNGDFSQNCLHYQLQAIAKDAGNPKP